MDLFGKTYLQTLKDKFRQDSPSKAVMDALRELQRINTEQTKQIRILKQHIQALKMENKHLAECLQHIRHDHEEYRINREKRDRQNLAIQIELRREIEALQWRLVNGQKDLSHEISYQPESDLVSDIVQIEKRILDLTESNHQLTRNLLQATGDEMIDLRSQMRSNNQNIAKLKASLMELKSREKNALEHTNR